VRFRGGVYAEPSVVLFGALPVNGSAKRSVRLYETNPKRRTIERVTSTHPERFEVRFLPARGEQQQEVHERVGPLIGRLEVTPRTGRQGQLSGEIDIFLEDEQHRVDRIMVMGEVLPDIECWPSTLVLPRRVEGRTLYSGEVLLLKRDGKLLKKVELEPLPHGLSATLHDIPGADDRCILRVEAKAPKNESNVVNDLRVRIRAGSDSGTSELRVVTVGGAL
jgi:hypothetical protein